MSSQSAWILWQTSDEVITDMERTALTACNRSHKTLPGKSDLCCDTSCQAFPTYAYTDDRTREVIAEQNSGNVNHHFS